MSSEFPPPQGKERARGEVQDDQWGRGLEWALPSPRNHMNHWEEDPWEGSYHPGPKVLKGRTQGSRDPVTRAALS